MNSAYSSLIVQSLPELRRDRPSSFDRWPTAILRRMMTRISAARFLSVSSHPSKLVFCSLVLVLEAFRYHARRLCQRPCLSGDYPLLSSHSGPHDHLLSGRSSSAHQAPVYPFHRDSHHPQHRHSLSFDALAHSLLLLSSLGAVVHLRRRAFAARYQHTDFSSLPQHQPFSHRSQRRLL